MKKFISVALAAAMMLGMGIAASAHDAVTTAVFGTPEFIDGEKDAGWDYAESIQVADFVESDYSDIGSEKSSAVVWSMWDGTYVYFFAEVTDPNPNGTVKDDLWNQDALGFMLNYNYATVQGEDGTSYRGLGADGYAGYTNIAPTFDEPETHSKEGDTVMELDGYYDVIESYVVETDKGWNVEVRMPLAAYKTFQEGDKIGYEICLNMAGADENTRIGQSVWKYANEARGQESWTDPYNFGTLILGAAPVIETEAEVVEVVEDAAAAPQTFDAGVIAAVAAVVSLAGYAVSKKR